MLRTLRIRAASLSFRFVIAAIALGVGDISLAQSAPQRLLTMPLRQGLRIVDRISSGVKLRDPFHLVAGELKEPRQSATPERVAYIRLSRDLIAHSLPASVDQSTTVSLPMLGTTYQGACDTSGTTRIVCLPNSRAIELDLRFAGASAFDVRGQYGSVRIDALGRVDFEARKRVRIDADGVHAEPTRTKATAHVTSTRSTTSARLFRRLAVRVADRQVDQRLAEARRATVEHAERSIGREVDALVDKQLAAQNLPLDDLLALLRSFPDSELRFASTADGVEIAVVRAGANVVSPGPPVLLTDAPDCEIHLHAALLKQLLAGEQPRRLLGLCLSMTAGEENRAAKLKSRSRWSQNGQWLTLTLEQEAS